MNFNCILVLANEVKLTVHQFIGTQVSIHSCSALYYVDQMLEYCVYDIVYFLQAIPSIAYIHLAPFVGDLLLAFLASHLV